MAYIVVEAAANAWPGRFGRGRHPGGPQSQLQAALRNSDRRIAPEWVSAIHDENRLILKMDEICKHLENQRQSGQVSSLTFRIVRQPGKADLHQERDGP